MKVLQKVGQLFYLQEEIFGLKGSNILLTNKRSGT